MAAAPLKMGLREANQRFSRAIRAVRAGRTVVITDRGRPLAVLRPVEVDRTEDEGRMSLVLQGLLIPASRTGPLPRFRPVKLRGRPLEETIREERNRR